MSYELPASEGGSHNGGKEYGWFTNAVNGITKQWLTPLEGAFSSEYGYKVYWRSSLDGKVLRRFVEFPNEAEATLFVLRWS